MTNPLKSKKIILTAILLVIFAVTYMIYRSSAASEKIVISNDSTHRQNIPTSTPTPTDDTVEIAPEELDTVRSCASAWLYAGSCDAQLTYQSQQIHTLKAQWAQIDNDGALKMWNASDYGGCGYNEDAANDVKSNSTEQFLTIITSCDELSGFRALIASPDLQNQFTQDTLAFLDTTGWTGIDIDFECYHSWTSEDMKNYVTFLSQYVQTLSRSGYKVNVAINPKLDNTSYPQNFDYSLLVDIPVNEWEIMTYDYAYSFGSEGYMPVQDLEWAKKAYEYASSILDPKDISMGIPAYGYHVKCDAEMPEPMYFNGKDVEKLPGYSTGSYNKASGEYTWSDGDNCYWYSDQKAMDTKRLYLEGLGVRKVAVWSIGGGNDWFTSEEDASCLAQ